MNSHLCTLQPWDVHLVLQEVTTDNGFRPEHIGLGHDLADAVDIFAMEVSSSRAILLGPLMCCCP